MEGADVDGHSSDARSEVGQLNKVVCPVVCPVEQPTELERPRFVHLLDAILETR